MKISLSGKVKDKAIKEKKPAKPLKTVKDSDLQNVSKEDRKAINKLLKGLKKKTEEALKEGKEMPDFDLCQIGVPGTNLFCNGNKGIPREKMPQLKGFPIPGTPAAELPKDKNGKVSIEKQFRKMLKKEGIKMTKMKVDPATLKATQNQLVGAKIAMRVAQLKKNPEHPKFTMPYFISKDGYILDGHHGWASVLGYSLITKHHVKINVIQVDMKIKPLVKLANKFMEEMGISKKAATAGE